MAEPGSPRSFIAPARSFPSAPPAAPASIAPPASGSNVPLLLFFPAAVLSLTTTNANLTLAAVLSLGLIMALLWRPGQPPALVLVCGMQWVQGALMTLQADVTGVELYTLTYARSIESATYLTLAWVSSLAVGAWLVTRKLSPTTVAATKAVPIAMGKLIVVFLVWRFAAEIVARLGIRSAAQLIGAITSVRWVFLFAIFAYGWRVPRWRPVVAIVLVLEVGLGFLSFFSAFKVPLILFAVALATAGYRPSPRSWIGFAAVFAVTLYLGVVWSAIKMDYRDRLNGGQGVSTQVVTISMEERIESFVDLVGTIDDQVLAYGVEALVRRLAYVEYCAYVIDYVPAVRDHERGKLFGAAITHILMPRIFFPDKARLPDETEVTEMYTGLSLGSGSGTSISIGIVGEAYIDFGPIGVVAFGLLVGLLIGLGYRYFITQRQYGAFAQGVAVALCVSFGTVENGAVKTLGGLFTFMIVYAVLWRTLIPWLVRWMVAPAGSAR